MAEKIKRTHAERDALLSKVFDSTLQTKDIEITEAGTMEITPDEGFFALKKVNLNVNVQGGGGNNLEYLDVSGLDEEYYDFVIEVATLAKKKYYILPTAFVNTLGGDNEKIIAVAVDFTQECYIAEISSNTLQLSQIIDALGITDIFSSLPRLTKEEFYAM